MLRSFITANIRLSGWVDRLLPMEYRIDGNRDFIDNVIPPLVADGIVLYDVGGGKHPCIGRGEKLEKNIQLVGIDIDAAELAAAPPGTYDNTICTDIAAYRGRGDADLVVCRALLEHVKDVPSAVKAIASVLKRGGRAALFVPSRNAAFARLNLLLPESVKKRLLYAIFPGSRRGQGFKSYYSNCTERDILFLANGEGMRPELVKRYWSSGYFTFFAPLHLLWRAGQLLVRAIWGNRVAETLTIVLRRE